MSERISSENISARTPVGLIIAAAVAAIEGVAFVMLGGRELVGLGRGPGVMIVTTSVFFLAYGIALLATGRGLLRRQIGWRGPLVMAQIIQVLVARSFWGGETRVLAAVLIGLAVLAIVAVMWPSSTAALEKR